MEDDWDLHAVVRSCTATTAMTNISSSCFGPDFRPQSSFSSSYGREYVGHLLSLPVQDPFETRSSGNGFGDLEELYKPFFRKSSEPVVRSPRGVPVSSLTPLFSVSHEQPISFQPKQQAQQQPPPKQSRPSVTSSATSHTPRSKKRKNQLKKVCQVPADALSSDVWAWRKYGQKPIKGSPFPRGYYRCSSSKGCIARKQVERNKSDPGMFTVTYTGEHNHLAPTHRNSLAGSTRQKTVSPQTIAAADDSNDPSPSKPTCSSPATSLAEDELLLTQSTNTESREDIDFLEDEEEDELCGFSEMAAASNEFFAGLEEELAGSIAGDRFSDRFAPRFGHPWLANNAATAAGGF